MKICQTNGEMEAEALKLLDQAADAAVCAASVLDFLPNKRVEGKIKSKNHHKLEFTMERTHKIIEKIKPKRRVKVGFKLESHLNEEEARDYARAYMSDYDLSLMVLNQMGDVSLDKHTALIYAQNQGRLGEPTLLKSKEEVARFVASHVYSSLSMEK